MFGVKPSLHNKVPGPTETTILLLVFTSLSAELAAVLLSGYRTPWSLKSHFNAPTFYANQAVGGHGFGHRLETLNQAEGNRDAYSASSYAHTYSGNLISGYETTPIDSNDLQDVFSLAQKAIVASRASLEISRTQSHQGDDRRNGDHEIVHSNRHPPHRYAHKSPGSVSRNAQQLRDSHHPMRSERLRHMDTPTFQDYHR